MKRFGIIFLLAGLLIQCKASRNNLTDLKVAEEYASYIKTGSLRSHLHRLASDDFEGREAGELGQKKAAVFLKSFYLENHIQSPLNDSVYFQKIPSSYFNYRFKSTENVVAMIKGSECPDQIVVVSAHYDHLGINENGEVYNGADDNASGTVAVMEIAGAFIKAVQKGYRPRRTLLFLHFTGEEKGLVGSQFYVENPIFPLKNTVTDINTDMIGRIDNLHKNKVDYVYLIGSDRLSAQLDSIINQQNRKHTKLQLDYKYNAKNDSNRFYYRSDHYNFAKQNIPVVFFFNGVHKDYHQTSDTADKIDYNLLTKRTKLIFYTVWEVANRDERLKVDKK